MGSPRHTWHPELIKAAVRMKGVTLTELATRNGLCASACREALLYSRPTAERVISDFLGVPLPLLWPERYDAKGTRRSTIVGKRARKTGAQQRLSAGAV
jgi:Ner family transcriptional regulator